MKNILRMCLVIFMALLICSINIPKTLGANKAGGNDIKPAVKPVTDQKDNAKEKEKWFNELINKLHSSDLWVRVEAIKKLGDTEDSKALPSLKQALGDESIDINVEALRALKKIGREEIKKGNDESFKLLLRGIILYNMQSLRFYALDGAASIDAEKTRKYLMNNLRSYFPDTQGRAAEGLANLFLVTDLRDKNTVQELIDTLGHNSEDKQRDKINDALKIITGANARPNDAVGQAGPGDKEQWNEWLKNNKDKVDAPAKKIVTENKPLPLEEKIKSNEQKNAEKKLEEFKDKAVLDKPANEPSASYYITRTKEGKKLMLAAFGHKDNRISRLVDESLNWLHRHQEKEGYWDFDGYIKNCAHGNPDDVSKIKGEHDVAVTGLALLAFLGAGHTHMPGQKVETSTASQPNLPPGGYYKPTIERGLKWLVSIQMGDGSFKNPVTGDAGNKVSMFDQAMATLAISEAYGMTGDEALKVPAQKAINFISNAKSPGKGWRYTPCSGDSDTSLVGWQVFALKSGKVSGLDVDRADFELASAWLDNMTNLDNGRVGYHEKGTGSPAITSIGIICRMLLGWRNDSPLLKKGADFVIADKSWQKGTVNFYHIYQTALAMFQMGGNYWDVWNKEMTDYLASTISKEGCERGSWPAGDDKYCQSRVYTTALGALSLEVYWRYLPFAR